MNKTRLLFLIVNLIAVVVIVWLIRHPGSRLVPLAIFAFVMSILGFYYGFIYKGDPVIRFWRSRTQAGAVIFFIMAIALAFWSRQERSGLDVISEWVAPYPKVSEIMLVPALSEDYVWGWILESPDPPDRIVDFYSNEQNTQGWDVTGEKGLLFLKKPGFVLMLFVREKPDGSGIYYQLKQVKAE